MDRGLNVARHDGDARPPRSPTSASDRYRVFPGDRRTEIGKESPSLIPSTPYSEFCRFLQTGDLLFFAGHSAAARLVRAAMQSPWSHVGIVVRTSTYDGLTLLDSMPGIGVRLTPLGRRFGDGGRGRPYAGEIVVARHLELEAQPPAVAAMIDYGRRMRGSRAFLAELAAPLRMLRSTGSHSGRTAGFISSEFVDACFSRRAAGGLRPFFRAREDFISPADIWTDPRVVPIRRLVAQP